MEHDFNGMNIWDEQMEFYWDLMEFYYIILLNLPQDLVGYDGINGIYWDIPWEFNGDRRVITPWFVSSPSMFSMY